MQLDPGEICRLFEQWACSRHQSKLPTVIPCIILNYSLGADERDSLENVRKQCTRAILRGLRKYLLHIFLFELLD